VNPPETAVRKFGPAHGPLSPSKLLLSKWTAVSPQHKEKHFIVVRLIAGELADAPVEGVELEAVFSKRCFLMPWRELQDRSNWLQGWI
jgi:tryptophan-rich hypothetical protein